MIILNLLCWDDTCVQWKNIWWKRQVSSWNEVKQFNLARTQTFGRTHVSGAQGVKSLKDSLSNQFSQLRVRIAGQNYYIRRGITFHIALMGSIRKSHQSAKVMIIINYTVQNK